jgi:glutamate--cysteine ligase
MIQTSMHKQLIKNSDNVCDWFKQAAATLPVPIYSSYDIRDAGYKIANVDANIYPAGFNNICPIDKETSIDLMQNYLRKYYGSNTKKILLVTEEHTQNAYYWDNVYSIQQLILEAGYEIKIGFARPLEAPIELTSALGHKVLVENAMANSNLMKEFSPDLIISNNDFSDAHEEWAQEISLPINPPRELGWYQRKKSRYFKHYNHLAEEFAQVADLDPFLLTVKTEEVVGFDIESAESRESLAQKIDTMLSSLSADYAKRKIDQKPFVFVKNNAGTYGLAVIRAVSGEEVKTWGYKSRKKMKAAKGGRDVDGLIIQEGIPSIVKAEGATAEPVIYMIGEELAGGFLRTHAEKDGTESLNSPGAVYKKLCVSDLATDLSGCPKENVYGWSGKLGLLAIAREAKEMGVEFKGYKT